MLVMSVGVVQYLASRVTAATTLSLLAGHWPRPTLDTGR